MRPDRRRLIQAAPLGLLASHLSWSAAAAADRRLVAGLIVPLTGEDGAVGRSMERAAAVAQPQTSRILAIDTRPGAATAARQALGRGARIILGPLFARDVPPVLEAVAGRAPVLSFTNDGGQEGTGAFVFGVTPAQSVSAVLLYARERGVRRVIVIAGAGAWGRQSLAAAAQAAPKLGLTVVEVGLADAIADGERAPQRVQALGDAALLADIGDPAGALGALLTGSGVQVLGTSQWLDLSADARRGLRGAWFAAPDPYAFAEFAQLFQARHGAAPTTFAALAYDAVRIAQTLADAGRLDRAGLIGPNGFQGVMGAVRFHADGSCARELAILVVEDAEFRVVERTAGA